jgi:hypothetical protein
VGWFVAPIGIAAAAGMTVYFVLAVAAHIRKHDPEQPADSGPDARVGGHSADIAALIMTTGAR